MSHYPDNLTEGFEMCAKKFGGKPGRFEGAWYSKQAYLYKYRVQKNTLVCCAGAQSLVNYKNNPRRANGKRPISYYKHLTTNIAVWWCRRLEALRRTLGLIE